MKASQTPSNSGLSLSCAILSTLNSSWQPIMWLACRVGLLLWPLGKRAWVFSCSLARVPIEAECKTEKESAWTMRRSSA